MLFKLFIFDAGAHCCCNQYCDGHNHTQGYDPFPRSYTHIIPSPKLYLLHIAWGHYTRKPAATPPSIREMQVLRCEQALPAIETSALPCYTVSQEKEKEAALCSELQYVTTSPFFHHR